MKRSFVRLFSAFFGLTLLLSSCGGRVSDPAREDPLEESLFDYRGEELLFYSNNGVTSPFTYRENTSLADAALIRLDDVGQKLNCSFTIICPPGDMAEYISVRAAAAAYYADIVFSSNSTRLRMAAQSNSFVPIDEVSSVLDFHNHEKWGTVEVLETMMCKGTLYGVCPQTWINLTAIPYYSLIYNRDLVSDLYGMQDPHELYENRTWTRDALEDYILSCYSVEESVTTVYGIAATTKHLVRQAILSNGCQMVETDDQGKPSCGWTKDAAVEALSWAQQLITEHGDAICYHYDDITDWDTYIPFSEGKASFLLSTYSVIFNNVSYDLKNFGLMPWPAGPNQPYGQWVGYYEAAAATAIPNDVKDIEGSSIAIDLIFEPMEEYRSFEDIKNYYFTNVLHDELDVEILFGNRNNPLTQYCYWPDGGDDFLNQIQAVATKPKSSVVEAIEKNTFLLEKVIETDIVPNRLVIDKYN